MWIVSSEDRVVQTEFEINSQIFQLVTENGNKADVYESKEFGKVYLFNNGDLLLESLSFIYAEALAHISVCSHYNPKNILLVGSPTSLVALELSKYKHADITFIPLDGELLLNMDRFGIGKNICERIKNIKIVANIDSSEKFDVIIYDGKYDSRCRELVKNHLQKDGLALFGLYDLVMDREKNTEIFKEIYNDAIIIAPLYLHYNPAYPKSYCILSKIYHPVADMNVQRSEMLEGVSYYSRYIHQSCFEIPKFVLQKYSSLLKQ